jgi:hypothetical protein
MFASAHASDLDFSCNKVITSYQVMTENVEN